ncbi:MAG: hemerythrin domain-containing protein [Methanomassiliicoccales archaeon]
MIEHRLIEKMVHLLQRELDSINSGAAPRYSFLRDTVDFLENYADRCHHGKEEDILFRELAKKRMPSELATIMAELMAEHGMARANVSRLSAAVDSGMRGIPRLEELKAAAAFLVDAYPRHILKEDKRFFIPCMSMLNAAEQERMLRESYDFDMRLVHERYGKMVKGYEAI